MIQGEYLGFWIMANSQSDFNNKCKKISNGNRKGFIGVAEMIKNLQSQNKELIELNELLKDKIIDAFREGRKTGAIFKTQKDSELFAEQYLKDSGL